MELSGTNLVRAGDHNQRVTLHAIRVNGPVTRTDLAAMTGLTAAAIANITKRLRKHGLREYPYLDIDRAQVLAQLQAASHLAKPAEVKVEVRESARADG